MTYRVIRWTWFVAPLFADLLGLNVQNTSLQIEMIVNGSNQHVHCGLWRTIPSKLWDLHNSEICCKIWTADSNATLQRSCRTVSPTGAADLGFARGRFRRTEGRGGAGEQFGSGRRNRNPACGLWVWNMIWAGLFWATRKKIIFQSFLTGYQWYGYFQI